MNRFLLGLIFVVCFSLATILEPRFQAIRLQNGRSNSIFATLMGDSRQMFANHFFAKADAYFHNGNYPTIFDTVKSSAPSHMTAHAQDGHEGEDEKEEGLNFLKPPKDWIEAFGRHFIFTEHTHLEGNGSEREILPWIRLSADMDSHRVETFVTASYWLRKRLNKPLEAEKFIREGLSANPDSSEILLELGRIYFENKQDIEMARNIWEIALQKWLLIEAPKKVPNRETHLQILGSLVQVEEHEGRWIPLISYLRELKKISPDPDSVEKQIQEAQAKIASAPH